EVAIKFMLPDSVADSEARSRFLREARNAVRLRSEHVARILDIGSMPDGSPYIVMEHLHGQDISVLLQQFGPLGYEVIADLVIQTCDALAEAHALGIVHRDLKPGNLFLTHAHDGSQVLKVLDFGISKSTAADAQITQTSAVMGSPAYMSPEQLY